MTANVKVQLGAIAGRNSCASAWTPSLDLQANIRPDLKGAIGRRYRRQDEAGTPFCVTIDGETNADGSVTIRDRDTLQQRRVPIGQVRDELLKALSPQG